MQPMWDYLGNNVFTSWNQHVYGNLFLCLLYLRVSLSVAKKVFTQTKARNIFAISIALISFLMMLSFYASAVFTHPWNHPKIETAWLILGIIPAALFLYLRKKQGFILGSEEAVVSYAKFNRLKDEFLSVASHELRTPLAVINGFAEILVREKLGPLNEEQKRRVRKILMQGQRLNRIIDDLLDLSRIRSGKIEVRHDVFDLVPVLKACLDDHQVVCDQQHLEMKDQIPDVLPDVIGDIDRITQIIVNLLNNAIKYTEPGGRIILRAMHDEARQEVRVEVQDSGIGIHAEDVPHVFEEFYRANRHGKKYSGTGLGLTIVHHLVEALGGKVGVESEGLGKGSRFFFTLQIAKNKSKSNKEPVNKHPQEVPRGSSADQSTPR